MRQDYLRPAAAAITSEPCRVLVAIAASCSLASLAPGSNPALSPCYGPSNSMFTV